MKYSSIFSSLSLSGSFSLFLAFTGRERRYASYKTALRLYHGALWLKGELSRYCSRGFSRVYTFTYEDPASPEKEENPSELEERGEEEGLYVYI